MRAANACKLGSMAVCALMACAVITASGEALPVSRSGWQYTMSEQGVAVRPESSAKWISGSVAVHKEHWKGTNCWIRGKFVVPAGRGPKTHLATLEFPSIGGNLVVFVNGKKAGERLGPFGFLDVTDCATVGTNALLIYATSAYRDVSQTESDDKIRNIMKRGDRYPRRAGVCLDPVLHLTKRVGGVFDAWAETSWREKKLTVKVKVPGKKVAVPVTVRDAEGRVVKKATVPAGADKVEIPWKDPILWDIDKGYLYTCEAGDFSFKFGFREVWVDGKTVMMNGHPLHLRVEMQWFPLTEERIPFFRQLGFNAYYIQAHVNAWFRYWHEVPDYTGQFERYDYGKMLEIADREGIAMMMPAVSSLPLFWLNQTKDAEKWWERYREMNEYFLARTRRHPAIIAHCASINLFNPKDAIAPPSIGLRRTAESYVSKGGEWPWKARLVDKACAVVKSVDPTRLVYGHGEGCVGGDFGTANNYPNLTPAQEVWDYPEIWAEKGDMPYFACEFGTYDGSYFKNFKRCLLTEYDAIYIGPRAYAEETDAYRDKLIEAGLKNNGYGTSITGIRDLSPAYDDLQNRFEQAADVSWRSYGMLAWHLFMGGDYGSSTNLNVHGRSQVKWMQPFLGYIGGWPEHSDKTHAYRPGEHVEKGLIAMWDSGRGPLKVTAGWRVVPAAGGDAVAKGKTDFTLAPFAMTNCVISFKAPAPGKWALEAVFAFDGKKTKDRFAFEVREVPKDPKLARRVWLYDPKHESGWVTNVVKAAKIFPLGGDASLLDPARDILVIGRRAVDGDSSQPHLVEQVKAGLKVLFLEQMPISWDLLGLRRNADVFVRNAFFAVPQARDALATLYEGLDESDLAYWRGRPTLVPEYKYTRQNICCAPKGSGRHAIASTVFEIPTTTGYKPLFICEFDLNYTPLLEWDFGRGCVVYNTFDFTDRIGKDVSAMALAVNLFRYLDSVDPHAETEANKLKLHIGLSSEDLAKSGIKSESRTTYTLPLDGEMAGVLSANLVRWRDKITYAAITEPGAEMGGAWFRKGNDCYLQVAPEQMDGRYKDVEQGFKWTAINTSVERLRQMVGRVQTYLGAASAEGVADIAAKGGVGGSLQAIPSWTLLGPYWDMGFYRNPDPEFEKNSGLSEACQAALIGDVNPNVNYTATILRKRQTQSFRRQIGPGADGVVEIGSAMDPEGKTLSAWKTYFAYAVADFESPVERDAILAMNANRACLLRLYVNGEEAVDMTSPLWHSLSTVAKDDGRFRFLIRLKKGENILTLKISNLPKSQIPAQFSMKISDEGWNLDFPYGKLQNSVEIYDSRLNFGGAYGYHYW